MGTAWKTDGPTYQGNMLLLGEISDYCIWRTFILGVDLALLHTMVLAGSVIWELTTTLSIRYSNERTAVQSRHRTTRPLYVYQFTEARSI